MASVAQQIPSIILEKVIDYALYATGTAESPYHHCICFPYRHAVLLLGVCRWWRSLVLGTVYCEVYWCNDPECSLCAGCRRNGCSSLRTFADALGSGHLVFARTAKIHCRIEDIASGAAIDTLRNAAFAGLAVPGVRSLEFHFSSITDRSKFILLNETAPAVLFCDEIRRMFPGAHSVAVSDLAFQYWHYHEAFIKRLLSGLFAGIPSVHTIGAYPALDKVLSVNPTSIRSLSVGGVWPTEPKIELIRRHSETLEYLCVSDDTPEAFRDILVRHDGRPIEYPRVRTLILDLDTLMYTRKQVVYQSPEGTPFPSLQHLVCIPEYPFANDILFRGNEDRLEVVRIHVTPPVIRALTRDGIARIGRFPALHFAEVTMLDTDSDDYMQLDPDGYDSDDSDSSFISAYHYEGYESDMAQLIFSMGQNARIIKSTNYFTDFSSVQLRYSDIGRYIKVLDMRFIGFTLGQQLELIKHLTCLTHFGASLTLSATIWVSYPACCLISKHIMTSSTRLLRVLSRYSVIFPVSRTSGHI
ncbi:hypothetical protein DL89DRAFT_264736 [Linderina pennispora]|uniref:Uncharacterized protein n=1 Tax=Linderina pennispora TaxID=61395 RepID=A0A1Y1WP86_9FUNG|nr:uncharacterized protein DL89DRAFT_264736 [Linderina pennispora]ORX74944.1 hypothetical protein DL89DRAFT_264736 [Linderina pennispora]